MRATKKEKLGNYICKVGKYDVRQIIKSGGTSRRTFGKVTQTKGSCEGRIYLGKKLIEGNLKSSSEAVQKAFQLTCREGDQQYVDKRLLKKHQLVCV